MRPASGTKYAHNLSIYRARISRFSTRIFIAQPGLEKNPSFPLARINFTLLSGYISLRAERSSIKQPISVNLHKWRPHKKMKNPRAQFPYIYTHTHVYLGIDCAPSSWMIHREGTPRATCVVILGGRARGRKQSLSLYISGEEALVPWKSNARGFIRAECIDGREGLA